MKNNYFKLWLIAAISGLVLIGFGLSLFGEAVIKKYEQAAFSSWFWWGTLSLVVVNSGLSLIGQSVIYKIKYDLQKHLPH